MQNIIWFCADVSTTMIVRPGPVIEFLLFNQNIKNPHEIDWGKVNQKRCYWSCFFFIIIKCTSPERGITSERSLDHIVSMFFACFFFLFKAKRALKNLRIKTTHTGSEFRIIGLSEDTCYSQTWGHIPEFHFWAANAPRPYSSFSFLIQVPNKEKKWQRWLGYSGRSDSLWILQEELENRFEGICSLSLSKCWEAKAANIYPIGGMSYFLWNIFLVQISIAVFIVHVINCVENVLPALPFGAIAKVQKGFVDVQQSTLVERSRQNPQERMFVLSGVSCNA